MSRSEIDAAPIKIALVGDSTVASYTAPATLVGWGQVLSEQFRAGTVSITNYAVPGESSKSFLNNNYWSPVTSAKPAYVFIQFGHNDNATGDFAKPTAQRTFSEVPPSPIVSPLTTRDYYRNNITSYINSARNAAIEPIIVLPMERHVYDNTGHIKQLNSPYAAAAEAVANAMGVTVIDLRTPSINLYETLGEAATNYLHADGGTDQSHFTAAGARLYAGWVADGLRSANHPLASALVPEPTILSTALTAGLLLRRRRTLAVVE